jgi:hypothetical protein
MTIMVIYFSLGKILARNKWKPIDWRLNEGHSFEKMPNRRCSGAAAGNLLSFVGGQRPTELVR